MAHPTFEKLINYLENKLPDLERKQIEAHLAQSCPQCQRKLSRIRVALSVLNEDHTAAPSTDVLKRAFAIYKKENFSSPNPIQRLVASLQFDSRLNFSAVGVRGVARTRQMLFTTDQVDIDLKISPEHEKHNLIGQILGSEPEGRASWAFVSLQDKQGSLLMGAETDALGQFMLKQIPSGTYDLIIDLGKQEVSIPDLEFAHD